MDVGGTLSEMFLPAWEKKELNSSAIAEVKKFSEDDKPHFPYILFVLCCKPTDPQDYRVYLILDIYIL